MHIAYIKASKVHKQNIKFQKESKTNVAAEAKKK